MEESLSLIISTVSSLKDGEQIATTLTTEHLAACVSLVPEVHSYYHWEGTPQQSKEVLVLIKCLKENVTELCSRLTVLHPYEIPEIIVVNPDELTNVVASSYLQWAIAVSKNSVSNITVSKG